MSHVSQTVARIQQAAGANRLAELARRARVPYTTLVNWRDQGWRPRAVVTLERLEAAAEALLAEEPKA